VLDLLPDVGHVVVAEAAVLEALHGVVDVKAVDTAFEVDLTSAETGVARVRA